jgi:hypothetical protein
MRQGTAKLAHLLFAVVVASVTATGCQHGASSAPPPLYAVTGKVVCKSGASLAGGTIEFRSRDDPTVRGVSTLQDDGSFVIHTIHGDRRLPGAIAGTHQVTIFLPLGEEKERPPVEPIVLPHEYTVEPRDNQFTIEIDRPRDSSGS